MLRLIVKRVTEQRILIAKYIVSLFYFLFFWSC